MKLPKKFPRMVCLLMGTVIAISVWLSSSISWTLQSPAIKVYKSSKSALHQPCPNCQENTIDQLMKLLSHTWKKSEANTNRFRLKLSNTCKGASMAIVTQANTPVRSKIMYDGEKFKPLEVTPKLLSTFVKVPPFTNHTMEMCAVVGNGGILVNSSCGEKIDTAQFVIRCNLPPLDRAYERDAGNKTHLVTANPSILKEKFESLLELRRPFVERMRSYSDSLLMLPAFSYGQNTALCLRTVYTLQDFNSPVQPVFLNPEYLRSLTKFWKAQGLRAVRLSTGLIVASLAMELCNNVNLYGFWPFAWHPHDRRPLTNHYYDNRQSNKVVHAMPEEFNLLLRLHNQGVVRLHLGSCVAGGR